MRRTCIALAAQMLFMTSIVVSHLSAQQTPSPSGHLVHADSLVWRSAGPGTEMAVVDGDPRSDGAFVIALRFAPGGMIPPHWHPKETRVVVISGEAQVGFGDTADLQNTKILGPGGYAVIPAAAHHFEAGHTKATVYVYGIGPLQTTMVNGSAAPHTPSAR